MIWLCFTPNYLVTRNRLFCLQSPLFYQSKQNDLSKEGIFLSLSAGGEEIVVRWGTKASPIPVYFVAVLYLSPVARGLVVFVTVLHLSPFPSHALDLFAPLSLSDSRGTFGCLIRGSAAQKHQPPQVRLSRGLPGQRSVHFGCSQTLLVHPGWLNTMLLPTQPLTPRREEANSSCKAQ